MIALMMLTALMDYFFTNISDKNLVDIEDALHRLQQSCKSQAYSFLDIVSKGLKWAELAWGVELGS